MIKLTARNYKGIVQRQRREWPRYATQLMNIAGQNCKATSPKNIGSCKDAWTQMRSQGIPGTLQNWIDFYNRVHGEQKLVDAGKRIHVMLLKMGIEWISEDMAIDYAKEIAYNKTHMGLGGEEMAVEAVAQYFGKEFRFSTLEEESQGTDAWIDGKPVQVKPHDSVFKAHVHNHANRNTHLIITYEDKKESCYIHNPEFMVNK